MKLTSTIARYLRRCGYAVAITLATGATLHAATQETVIEFLTHEGGMPESIANQSEYSFNLPLSMPEVPEGTTVWGTEKIEEALSNGDAYIKAYAPFRMNYDYQFFKLNDSIGDFSNRVMKVSNAIRPTLQEDILIHTSTDTTAAAGKQLRKISYFGARSFAPSTSDSNYVRYSLTSDDDFALDALRNGERVYVYKLENGNWKKESSYLGEPLMQADGTQAQDADGYPIFVYNTASQLDANKQYTIADANGNEQVVRLTTDTAYDVARSGDFYLNRREQYLLTDTPIDVHDNLLSIDHSGFMLAVGAYSEYGDVYNNRLYIQDVRVSDDMFAAATYNGDSYNNTAVIIRAEAIGQNTTLKDEAAGVRASDYNNSGKVCAVFSGLSNVNNDAWDNTVFVYGSSIYQDVTGAYTGGNAINNTAFITHSSISVGLKDVDPTRGGYSARTGTANNNTVIIDDTFDADAAGIAPEVVDDTVAGGWSSSVPEVSTIYEDIQGGATSRAYGDNGAHNNKVIVLGATASDGTRTTIEGNVFGGVVLNNNHTAGAVPEEDYDLPAASATGNMVYIKGAQLGASVITSRLEARSQDENIWDDWVVSTDVGRICGGYAGAPQEIYELEEDGKTETFVQQRTPGNANDNTVIVMDTRIANSIYGGTNLGTGQASNNTLHLSHLDTSDAANPGEHNDFVFYGGWIDTYATMPHNEDYQGHTNNNQVWLYDTGWSMDNTFLHGGWGKGIRTDEDGCLIWKDDTRKIAGAASFDGTYFYDKNNKVMATLTLSQLVAGTDGDGLLGSGVAAFDGEYFYDYARNNIGTYQSVSVGKPVYKNGQLSYYNDFMPAVDNFTAEADGTIKFYASGNLRTDSGPVSGNKYQIATYYPKGTTVGDVTYATGTIVSLDGSVLLDGIDSYDTATQSFKKGETVLASILNGTIVNADDQVKAWGISDSMSLFDESTGNYYFKDSEGNVLATFQSSSIDGQDENQQDIHIDIYSYETDEKNGIVMYKRGELSELFEHLTGRDEYIAYTKDNWLHIAGFQGKIKGFDHFEKLRFYFTEEIDLTKPMLTLTGEPEETGLTMIKDEGSDTPTPIEVEVDISAIADQLKPGDVIPVIGHEDNSGIDGMDEIPEDVVDDSQKHRSGVTRTVQLDTEFKEWTGGDFDNFGVIEVMGRTNEVTPESKSLIEGRIATLTLNNMGGNLLAEQGIDSACRALEGSGEPANANHYVAVEQNGKGGVAYMPKDELEPGNRLFFAMSGAHNKVDSGSDVDVDGTNALVGVSRGMLAKRALTLGVFMETGWGKYHTHNNFGEGANVPAVRGTGETSYVGAGALMRYHLKHLGRKLDGVSLDASVRAGRQETDYSTADLMDDYGTFASYEHESDYIAGHVGVNYTFEPADKLSATLYARYLWTHVSGEDAEVCGETVNFDDMSSNRFRFGGRLAWQATEKWTPYLGAAWEWECSGTARATTYGMGISAPSMRGGSVIGEIGTVWQPSLSRALWVEAALQGSVGKNENYGARLGISIGF